MHIINNPDKMVMGPGAFILSHKTAKTLCGKRVASHSVLPFIDNNFCSKCVEIAEAHNFIDVKEGIDPTFFDNRED